MIATLFGVCTSLGLGTMQINQGLHLLNPAIPVSTNAQLVIIWCITAVATGSVLTGQTRVKKTLLLHKFQVLSMASDGSRSSASAAAWL